MISAITGSDVFAQVMMARSLDPRLVLVVESPEDSGVLDVHLNRKDIHSVYGFGKNNLMEAARLFYEASVQEVMVLVDSDFDAISGANVGYPPNVVGTEFYDLDAEIYFVSPEIGESIALNFSDRKTREEHLEKLASDPVLEMAIGVGCVRFTSHSHALGLNMRSFPMTPLLDAVEQGGSHIDSVVSLAIARSKTTPSVTEADVERCCTGVGDLRILVSGHDLISALATACRLRWGGPSVSAEILARAFRSSVSCRHWMATSVYARVQTWVNQFGRTAWTCI